MVNNSQENSRAWRIIGQIHTLCPTVATKNSWCMQRRSKSKKDRQYTEIQIVFWRRWFYQGFWWFQQSLFAKPPNIRLLRATKVWKRFLQNLKQAPDGKLSSTTAKFLHGFHSFVIIVTTARNSSTFRLLRLRIKNDTKFAGSLYGNTKRSWRELSFRYLSNNLLNVVIEEVPENDRCAPIPVLNISKPFRGPEVRKELVTWQIPTGMCQKLQPLTTLAFHNVKY